MTLNSIAVIIVNYGTADLAIDAIESVLSRPHGDRKIEVHLVDNASPDDSAVRLSAAKDAADWGARVTLHLETENHGFGRGNNVVLDQLLERDTPPDAVLLLNPDACFENDVIAHLAGDLETHPSAGFAGAGIRKPTGEAVTAAFRFPSVLAEFSSALGFGPVFRALKRWQVPLPPDHPGGEVDWVAGAALMIRTQTLLEIGTFDPDFFLYFEEVELMWRGRQAGWTSRYVPAAQVTHIEGAATDVKSGRTVLKRVPSYRYDSWRFYYMKTGGRAVTLLAIAATLLGGVGNAVLSVVRPKAKAAPYFLRDFWTHAAKPVFSSTSRQDAK